MNRTDRLLAIVLELEGESWWAFPEAAALAATSPNDLAALLHNERKAHYLHTVARAFASVGSLFALLLCCSAQK